MSPIQDIVAASCAPPFKSKIIKGDVCKTLLRHPITHKFDIVIADPPYNIGKDFGVTKDSMPIDEYLSWTKTWIDRCLELLTDNGVIYVYGFSEILAHVSTLYPYNEQRWLVWHYTNKAVPSARFWQRSHEAILCLWKSGMNRPNLEIEQIREPYTKGYISNIGRVRAGTDSRFGSGKETEYKDYGGALPRDVIKIAALAGGAGATERWFICRDCNNKIYPPHLIKHHRGHDTLRHPTQKPMELTRRLFRSRIKGANGRALIPFAGSGSECVVATELGIDYMGIEINSEYVDFARKWLKTVSIDRKNETASWKRSAAII